MGEVSLIGDGWYVWSSGQRYTSMGPLTLFNQIWMLYIKIDYIVHVRQIKKDYKKCS